MHFPTETAYYCEVPQKSTSNGPGLIGQIESLVFFRYLFLELIRAEIVLRYRRSVLGVAWTILNPILLALVLFFLFRAIFKFKTLGETDFFPYVYCGVLLLTFITRAIVEASEQVHINSSTLRKIRIPAEVIVLSKVSGNFLNFGIGLFPLLAYLAIKNGTIDYKFVFTPFVLFPVVLVVSSISIILSVAYVFFRDVEHLMPTMLNLLFYVSPVFYSIDLIGGNTRLLVELNPLNYFLDSFRYLYGASDRFHLGYLAGSSIIGLFMLALSLQFMEHNRMRVILAS